MKDALARIKARPWIAHILRANTRFNRRLGNHFAASITYFTVLAMVPVIAFAFSLLSLVLTRIRPDLLDVVKRLVADSLSSGGGADKVSSLIDSSLATTGSGWTLAVTMLTALWAGIGWIGNLRQGVRSQWDPDFDMVTDNRGFLWAKLFDMLAFLGLLVALLLTVATSQVGSSAAGWIARVTHLDDVPGHGVLLTLAALIVSTAAGWILFMFLFGVLPRGRRNWRAIIRGSLIAGLLLGLLQVGAGYLVRAFSSNKAVQAFGSIIIVMLVFNLLARLILLISAWTATTDQPAVAGEWNDCDEPLLGRDDTWTSEGHWEAALADRARKEAEKQEADTEDATGAPTADGPDGDGATAEGAEESAPPVVLTSVSGDHTDGSGTPASSMSGVTSRLIHRPRRAGTVTPLDLPTQVTEPRRRRTAVGAGIAGAVGLGVAAAVTAVLRGRRHDR